MLQFLSVNEGKNLPRSKWLRLLADKAVEQGLVEHASHNAVKEILKKNDLQPHLKKQWCIGTLNAEYLARMEDPLHLYSLLCEAARPVICFDEQPVQLVADVVEPLAPQAGQFARVDYEYERHGVASLLVAFEPLTGKRLVETSARRTKADYYRFQQQVAATWPEATKIVLVQDNLNKHNTSSFYEQLPAADAFALAQRFEMHYTPKKGSWLDIAELELSALSRICLGRRIAALEKLDDEIQALVKERNEQKCKVTWQFSIPQAREKLKRHYEKVKPNN